MNKLKEEAFTLVEVLVVIIILGVVLAIAIPSVSNISNNNRNRMYKVYMDVVEEQVKVLIDEHKGELINDNHNCFVLNYETLVKQKIVIESDVHCDGSIIIRKSGNQRNFSSEKYLTCKDKNGDIIHESDSVPSGCSNFSIN